MITDIVRSLWVPGAGWGRCGHFQGESGVTVVMRRADNHRRLLVAGLCGSAWGALLITMLLVAQAQASTSSSLRCNGDLITRGDLRAEVRAACGEPDMIVPVGHMYASGAGLLPYEALWYYNEGPRRFIREVRLRDGRVVGIASRGYGFNPEAPGSCGHMDFRPGMTRLEVMARCGEPSDRHVRIMRDHLDPHRPRLGSTAVLEEKWVYNFGPHRFIRVLTLVDGRVREVNSAGRGYRE